MIRLIHHTLLPLVTAHVIDEQSKAQWKWVSWPKALKEIGVRTEDAWRLCDRWLWWAGAQAVENMLETRLYGHSSKGIRGKGMESLWKWIEFQHWTSQIYSPVKTKNNQSADLICGNCHGNSFQGQGKQASENCITLSSDSLSGDWVTA